MSEPVIPEYLRQSMVERVARALCRGRCHGVVHICDREANGACKPDKCLYWANHEDGARAAIAAMREPNLAMRHACTFSEAEVTWPKMIDAALAEEGSGT